MRLIGKLGEPALVRQPRRLQTELPETLAFGIEQCAYTEFLREALELSQRRSPLIEIYEMRFYATLGEESKSLPRIRAFSNAEDLNFHSDYLMLLSDR